MRKHIRSEKARIRRGVLDLQKQAEFISGLYKKIADQKTQQKPADKKDNTISAAAEKVLSVKK